MHKLLKTTLGEINRDGAFTRTRNEYYQDSRDTKHLDTLYKDICTNPDVVLKREFIYSYLKENGEVGYIHDHYVECLRWYLGDNPLLFDKDKLQKEVTLAFVDDTSGHSENNPQSEEEFEEMFCQHTSYVSRQGKTPSGRYDVLTNNTVWELKLNVLKLRDAIAAYAQAMEYKEHLGVERVGVASYKMSIECEEWLKKNDCEVYYEISV